MRSQRQLIDRVAFAEHILRPTPVVRLEHGNVDLYAKLEYLNGIGSLKDRPAFWILKRAIERGQITPGTTIIESSSGNFARALAVFASILTLDFIAVIDPHISPLVESALRASCTRVVKVDERDDAGGYLQSRLQTVQNLLATIPGSYWPNQYGNTDAMDAHYLLTAEEIVKDLPTVDYVFIGVSSTGTISGVSRRLKEHNPKIKVIAVDAAGSVIFGHKPGKRLIPGLGSSICPPLLQYALIDDLVVVSENDCKSACLELLDRHGLFVGGSTGGVYSAVTKFFPATPPTGRPKVLFLCCDSGAGYLHNIFHQDLKHSQSFQMRADEECVPTNHG